MKQILKRWMVYFLILFTVTATFQLAIIMLHAWIWPLLTSLLISIALIIFEVKRRS